MSTLKKILALSLALAMILSVSAFAGNYTADFYQDANAIDSDAAGAVEVLYALDIMVGNTTATGTEFRPNDTITREEVAKMIYVILNYGNDDKAEAYKASNIFADVTADSCWAAGYINYLAAVGMVQGDGTNFYPKQAVKTAEVAKMLLTAISYKAEDRGYVGAGWSTNVLNDAYNIQLLDGYKADLTGNAPRQWVAVMFFNALMNAYTPDVTVPTGFSGYFGPDTISGTNKFVRFGYKYLGVDTFTAYAYATEDGYIDYDSDNENGPYASRNYVLFSNDMQVKGTGLGLADLGQQYRVVYNSKKDVVYSCRPTGKSIVGEAMLKDITAEVKYSTSGNRSSNSYYFTVGSVVAPFAVETNKEENIKRDTAHKLTPAGGAYDQLAAKTLFDDAGTLKTETYKVIDKDGDGEIDYVFVIPYEYGRIVDVTTSAKYGTSVEVEVAKNGELGDLKYEGATKLFVDDTIICDTTLEKGNYVKYYYSGENGAYVMEVLPVVEAAEYTKRTSKGVFTFGDVDYQFAANGFGYEDNFGDMGRKYYGSEYDLVVDNGLLVFVGNIDDRYTTIDRINSKLVVVTDVRVFDSAWDLGDGYYTWLDYTVQDAHALFQITYMDIEGNVYTRVEYANENRVDSDDFFSEAGYVDGWDLLDRVEDGYPLFILHTESNNTVWCEAAVEPSDLYVSPSVVDDYIEGVASVNTKKNYFTTADDEEVNIDPDAKMFFRNEDGDYVVSTLNEMADGTLTDRIYQVYTLENNRGIDVAKAGYIDLCKYDDAGKDYGFLTLEDLGSAVKGQKELYNASIVLPGAETAKEATVLFTDEWLKKLDAAGYEPEEMLYHYELHAGVYTVEPVGFKAAEITKLNSNTESLKVNGETIYTEDADIVLANWTVELTEAVNDLDEAAEWVEENFQTAKFEDISFIDFDEIPEEVVVGNDEDDTYFYVTFFSYGKDVDDNEIVYIVLVKVVIAAQDFEPWWN